ncbi:MAG: hypothetical protein ACI4GA_00170 [Acutalibacteraceae bacterium]
MNNNIKKAVGLIMAAYLVIPFAGCSKKDDTANSGAAQTNAAQTQVRYDKAPKKVVKSETVYANMDTTGKTQNIIVSDWLHTDSPCVKVSDVSDLRDIVNVKGTETPEVNGEKLTWHMSSTDLYYRGYSDKKLPVSFSIKYYLDGNEVTPEKLAGATGKLKIAVKATNEKYETLKRKGKVTKVCEPLLVAGGMILDEEKVSGVTLTNGKAIGDGTKEIAMFVGLPGMAETFSFTKDELQKLRDEVFGGMDFSGDFVIEADVKDFELGNMYFAVLPLSSINGAMQTDDTLSGVGGLLSGLSDVVNAVYSIDVDKLIDTLMTNSDKIADFADLISDSKKLYEENKVLINIISSYMTSENIKKTESVIKDLDGIDVEAYAELLASDDVSKLISDLSSTDFSKYERLVSNPLFKTFFKDLATIMEDADKILPKLAGLSKDVESGKLDKLMNDCEALMPTYEALSKDLSSKEAQAAIKKLPKTVEKLKGIVSTLQQNEDLINTLSSTFDKEKVEALTKALESSENISINSMMKSITHLTDDPKGTTAILKKMSKLASSSTIYTKADNSASTSVVYVYRTPAIG